MSTTALKRVDIAGLVTLALFTAASVTGYGYFALHPENLPASGFALRLYSVSFNFFAQAHILLALAALVAIVLPRSGLRWLPAAIGVCVVAFTAEHLGTGYGIPFGGYEYTGLLGARIGPRVPALIPLSWLLMAIPSWVLAHDLFPRLASARVALGALGLVLWDLALDPAMSFLTPYWRWEETGAYYGMPWSNLLGWFVTGVMLMATIELLDRDRSLTSLPTAPMASYWLLVLSLPLGMLAAAGAWTAVVTTLATTAAAYAGARWAGGRASGAALAVADVPPSTPSPRLEEAPTPQGAS